MPIVPPGGSDLALLGAGATANALGLFSDKGYVFDPFKYDQITVGDQILPFQPLVHYRQRRNMVVTQVAGSGNDPDLSGSTVKENMGLSEAFITIEGFLMSFDLTPFQRISEELGQSPGSYGFERDWVNQLTELRLLFEAETILPIKDASGRFNSLGIDYVILQRMRVNDARGHDRRVYQLELIQERPIEIEKLLPTEEGEQ